MGEKKHVFNILDKQLQAIEPVSHFHFMHHCARRTVTMAEKWLSTAGLRKDGT